MPSNFKVLAGASGEPIDPNFRNVTLLLHGDGNNGGQNNAFVDSSSNHFPISRNGNTTQGSFSPYGSNWSNYFDGSGDYLSLPDNAALELGSSDITIEMWINTTNSTQYSTLYSRSINSFTSGDWTLLMNNSSSTGGEVGLYVANYSTSSPLLVTSGVSVRDGAWHHIAVVRNGSSWTIYIDGVSRATATWSGTVADVAGGPWIGKDQSFNRDYVGYISNLRFVKGTAVYTSAFTPSTTPLTAITNTSLLTCAYNRFRDGSTNNFTITRNGDVRVTNFAPFAPSSAAAYDQSDVQYWSGSFDGNGDYLSIANNDALNFGTGDMTVECWVYLNTTSGTQTIASKWTGSVSWIWQFTSTTTSFYFGATGSDFSWSPVAGTWYHLAITRASGSVKFFVNGVQTGATATNNTSASSTSPMAIGANNDGPQQYLNGHLSNFRVVKGTAVYTSNFTPPTAPLTAISGTSLLTCQNASFTDNSANKFAITANGNATVVGNSPYNPVGYWSNYFDGSGDYINAGSNAAFAFGTGTYTTEAWVYITGSNNLNNLFCNDSTNGFDIYFNYSNSTTRLEFRGGSNIIAFSGVPARNTWTHVALVREGTGANQTKLYFNGVLQGTGTDATNWTINGPMLIGALASTGADLNGYISNARIVKGTAVYTSNFTPSTTPLTAISGTSLLTCQANRFIDSSANAFTITPNGNVAVSDFDPFTGASVTSTGGSAYFDGSGDALTVARNLSLLPTTGDFTVEAWVYPLNATTGSGEVVVGFIEQGSTGDWSMFRMTDGTLGFYTAAGGDTFGALIPHNQWNHIAISRSGGTLYKCVNGTATSVSWSTTLNSNTGLNLTIGADSAADEGMFKGFISNIRLVNGTALYTGSTYTIPTAPLTAITNTSLLTNFTNAAIFDNSMKNDLETVGNAQISTSVKKFGTGSILFSTNSSNLVSSNANLAFNLETGDFTIEGWIYLSSTPSIYAPIIDCRTGATVSSWLVGIWNTGGALRLDAVYETNRLTGSSTTISATSWTHIAVTRASGTLRLFVNGVADSSTATYTGAWNSNSSAPLIGKSVDNYSLGGYLDDFRLTKGIARYTANFTPPTAPFPNK